MMWRGITSAIRALKELLRSRAVPRAPPTRCALAPTGQGRRVRSAVVMATRIAGAAMVGMNLVVQERRRALRVPRNTSRAGGAVRVPAGAPVLRVKK